jgi:transcriptional repressor NrdR
VTSVRAVRCPVCDADDDKVVDSRAVDLGAAVRRRRECLGCGKRFTTFERIEEVALVVVKRDGRREPFDRQKVVAGVVVAATDRPVSPDGAELLAAEVEEEARLAGSEVTSEHIGFAVLDRLERIDLVTAVRFASVYKGFSELADFAAALDDLARRR